MKKLLVAFLSVFMLYISTVVASDIPYSNINSPTNECAAYNAYYNYYLDGNLGVTASDRYLGNPNDITIDTTQGSLVKVWRGNGVLQECDNWTLLSNVVPNKNTLPLGAYIWKSHCTFTIPSYTKINNPTMIDAQVNYTVGYHVKKGSGTPVSGKLFYKDSAGSRDTFKCYSPFGLETSSLSSCNTTNNFKYGKLKIHKGECLNYRVFRCGDGLVNSPYGSSYNNGSHTEQCDPKDPNHTNWGLYGCTETCEKNDIPPVGQPDLTIDKEQITTGTMEAGSTVAYKITVKNEGSGTATGVSIYDLLPEELQYMTSSISIIPSSTYLFTTGTILSGTYIKYSNITLAANGTAIVYLTGKVKDGSTFDTLTNCASVSGNNIPVEEDCVKVTPPTPPVSAPTCNITLSANTITLGEPVTVNYQISGQFYNTHMYVSGGQILGSWPLSITNPQGSSVIQGSQITHTGGYKFWISGNDVYGEAFYCEAILHVVSGSTPPPPPYTGQADITIQKILTSVGPFDVGDTIQYKIIAENHGDATAVVPIWDVMPDAVTYLTSSIMFVPDIQAQHYTFSTGLYNGKFMFRYSNVSLAPGQKAIIYLEGVINDHYLDPVTYQTINTALSRVDCMYNWTTQLMAGIESLMTTNCAFTYTDGSGDNGSGTIIQSCVEFPKPAMVKYQSVRDTEFTRDQLLVAKNEIITYKIEFGNQSGEKMDDVHLLDVMPACVEYISSKVYGISGYGFSTGLSNNGNVLVNYSGFVLGSGQYGYMIVTGRISDSPACQNTYVYRNDAYMFYSGGRIDSFVVAKRPNVLLTKTGDGPHYNLTQPNAFFITVTNNSTGILYDVTLSEVDSWPTFSGCVNYIDWKGANFTKDPNALVWRYNSPLQPEQSINLTISGSIGSDASCIRDYINTVVLTCRDGAGYDYTLDAKYPFDVTTGESAELEKTVDKDKVSAGTEVVYTIRYKNIGHVDRDTGYSLTDIWPADVLTYLGSNCNQIATCDEQTGTNVIFTFNSVLHPGEEGTLILRGKVIRPRPNNERKRNRVILRYRTRYYSGTLDDDVSIEYEEDDNNCGNGILEGNEECDGGYDNRSPTNSGRFYIFDYLDFNRTRQAPSGIARSGYYCTQACKLDKISGRDYAYDIPSCLNVDTTISIMDKEIFPFWWRVWQRDKLEIRSYGKNPQGTCPYNVNTTLINKDSMTCKFSVYNGYKHNQSKMRKLNTFTGDCFSEKDDSLDTYFRPFSDEVKAFSRDVDFDAVASRQAWNLSTLLGGEPESYGEYKLALESVGYKYCAPDRTWKTGVLHAAICEVNFTVTPTYLMQVNTAGVPRATNLGFLGKFYDIAGNVIQTDLGDVIKVTQTSYNMNQNVDAQKTQFRNKYEKLAVTTTNHGLNGNIEYVKKVPNQSIYFIKGNGLLTLNNSYSILSKPYTLFIDGMDVRVNGSITTNGMIIVNDGTMEFSDTNCTSGGQVVQGIFIAKRFVSNNSTLNTTIEKEWCHRGNLHVKGVLIGNNISSITNSKRSQLNSWFETELRYANTNDIQLKKERRNEIFQGASVLIEYNPDTWMKSIPGAEIFTETLDVYRK